MRDLFQGVCRIGRKAGLLTDTVISCVVHDIDVVNAHFVIMMQVAATFGKELCSVLRVVQDRDAVLHEVHSDWTLALHLAATRRKTGS